MSAMPPARDPRRTGSVARDGEPIEGDVVELVIVQSNGAAVVRRGSDVVETGAIPIVR
jgi:hypothetical protein